MLDGLKSRLRSLFRSATVERELDSELQFHLEKQVELNMQLGMTAAEARRAALREFGGVDQTKERSRDARGMRSLQDLGRDLRYALRLAVNNPAFSLVAVLTLALGIGANSTIFSVINAVLLRPLPVSEPDRLASVFTSDFSSGNFGTSSYADYLDFRDRNQTLEGLVAYQPRPFSLTVEGPSERIFGEIVSGNYFTVLGVTPALGRGFLPEEDRVPGAHAVVVISHRLWRERFQSDPSVIGRTLKLNSSTFTIVGVAKEGYSGLLRGFGGDLWVPAMMTAQASPDSGGLESRGDRSFMLMGRLKAGATIAQARSDFAGIAADLYKSYPQQWRNIRNSGRAVSLLPEDQSRVLPDFRTPLLVFMTMLMATVGVVLLIACANVANLLLARATARRREIAIRLSLGASRGRLIRQLLTESVLIAFAGGIAGLLLSVWAMRLLSAFKPPVGIPIVIDLAPDWRVFAFTFFVCLVTGVLFGLAPALAATRADLVSSLKDESASSGASRSRGRLRSALVVAQVALSFVLLICSGLFIRSLFNAGAINPGFDADNLLSLSMDLRLQGYQDPAGKAFAHDVVERVRALPGTVSAALTESLPLGFGVSRRGITIEGYTAQAGESTEVSSVSVGPGYFDTMRIPVMTGRAFSDQDREGTPAVVMVNETFVRRYWRGESPVGKHLQMGSGEGNKAPHLEVIGVVKDGKYGSLGEEPIPFFYLNMLHSYESAPTLIVRTLGDPVSHLAAVRQEIAALDKNLPLYDVKTMRQHLGLALFPARIAGIALGVFGLVALTLAAAGLYGVMAYSVAQRTREIGVRMALGARGSTVLKLVIWNGVRLVLIGMTIGLSGAVAVTHLMTSLLYGVSATDPLTFLVIGAVLAFVALLASWIPARRATLVDPVEALRCS